jgi:Phosphate-selective porin O and P
LKSTESSRFALHAPSRLRIASIFVGLTFAIGGFLGTSPEARAEAQSPQQSKKKDAIEITGAAGKGLTVNVGKSFSLNIRSRIQLRYQLGIPPADDKGKRELQQIVNVGTARLWLSGHVLTPKLTYLTQLAVAGRDFRDDARSPIFDAYLEWRVHRDFNIRAGQFFVPFDRLRTVREFALQMADRPAPVNEFTLDRDVGIMFYSDSFLGDHSPLAWRIGVFGGGGTNLSTAKKAGGLFVGRLELRPLGPIDDDSEGDQDRRRKPGLAMGVGYALNLNTNRLRSTTGATFAGGTTDYEHLAADLVFKWRGFALQAEHVWRAATVDRIESTKADGSALTEYTRSGRGWVLQGSYTFKPPFEIVARLTRSYAATNTDPALIKDFSTRPYEVGTGFNYYLNGHRLKLQADWIARTPADFDLSKTNHVVHVQADATF